MPDYLARWNYTGRAASDDGDRDAGVFLVTSICALLGGVIRGCGWDLCFECVGRTLRSLPPFSTEFVSKFWFFFACVYAASRFGSSSVEMSIWSSGAGGV